MRYAIYVIDSLQKRAIYIYSTNADVQSTKKNSTKPNSIMKDFKRRHLLLAILGRTSYLETEYTDDVK